MDSTWSVSSSGMADRDLCCHGDTGSSMECRIVSSFNSREQETLSISCEITKSVSSWSLMIPRVQGRLREGETGEEGAGKGSSVFRWGARGLEGDRSRVGL